MSSKSSDDMEMISSPWSVDSEKGNDHDESLEEEAEGEDANKLAAKKADVKKELEYLKKIGPSTFWP